MADQDERLMRGCPFCAGRQIDLKEVEDSSGHHVVAACLDCGCEGPLGDDRGAAVALWNNRPCGE